MADTSGRFRDTHPSHGLGLVVAVQKRLPNRRPSLFQVTTKLLHRHTVDTGTTTVVFDPGQGLEHITTFHGLL
jgi:hypothetical protein